MTGEAVHEKSITKSTFLYLRNTSEHINDLVVFHDTAQIREGATKIRNSKGDQGDYRL